MNFLEAKKHIIASYPPGLVKLYCMIRFVIMRERFTREVLQYLPYQGHILDVGCGFGLFSLLFAMQRPEASFNGYDLNAKRIGMARDAAGRLNVSNAKFECADASTLTFDKNFNGGFMFDLVHHLPKSAVEDFLRRIFNSMSENSVFIIKDVDSRPVFKRWFTWAMDVLMVGFEEIHYWPEEELLPLLERIGWKVHTHAMPDWLPYPHRIYICRKGE